MKIMMYLQGQIFIQDEKEKNYVTFETQFDRVSRATR